MPNTSHSARFVDMYSRRGFLGTAFALSCMTLHANAGAPIELRIASVGDELAFEPDHLTCPTGASVRLIFHHAGEIIRTEAAFFADADKQSDVKAIPDGDAAMVLTATPICGKGEITMVDFVAPAPGQYTFVCSVPGHGETMQGVLTVTV